MSARRACAVIGADRTSIRYRSRRPDDHDLRERLRALASERRRLGYRRLHVLLRREGHVVNRKKTQRLYREEGLSVRKRRGRKKATGTRAPLLIRGGHAERALVGRFCPRSVRPRSADPDLQRHRRRDEGMPRRRGRHLDLWPACRPGTDGADRPAWQARPDRQRSRHRVHLERDAGLERRCRRALALHRPGQTDARHGICEAFNSKMRDELLNETLFFGLRARPRGRRPPGATTSQPRSLPR